MARSSRARRVRPPCGGGASRVGERVESGARIGSGGSLFPFGGRRSAVDFRLGLRVLAGMNLRV